MDIQAVSQAVASVSENIKAYTLCGTTLLSVGSWLYLRCNMQRRYLRQVRRLTNLSRYLEKRREAFSVLEPGQQIAVEEVEKQIVQEVGIDLSPAAVELVSLLRPAEGKFLRQAERQLSSEVFRDLAEDLLVRLMLWLDALVDLEEHKRQARWTVDFAKLEEERKKLRSQLTEDRKELELHRKLMQQFLSGQVAVDLYPPVQAANLRTVLKGKYEAYREQTAEAAREINMP